MVALPLKQVGGSLSGFGCFFLSGLPGGMDYVLLTLTKNGLMDAMTEKKWNCTINTWVRGPSMAMCAFLCWQNWILGKTTLVRWSSSCCCWFFYFFLFLFLFFLFLVFW